MPTGVHIVVAVPVLLIPPVQPGRVLGHERPDVEPFLEQGCREAVLPLDHDPLIAQLAQAQMEHACLCEDLCKTHSHTYGYAGWSGAELVGCPHQGHIRMKTSVPSSICACSLQSLRRPVLTLWQSKVWNAVICKHPYRHLSCTRQLG